MTFESFSHEQAARFEKDFAAAGIASRALMARFEEYLLDLPCISADMTAS